MTKYFEYRLTGTGWAEAAFASDKQTLSFEVSYLSDPLSDLFQALNRMVIGKTDNEKIVFAEEPGEHRNILERRMEYNTIYIWSLR